MLFISWLLCIIVNVFKQATCYYYKEEQMLHLSWYIIDTYSYITIII